MQYALELSVCLPEDNFYVFETGGRKDMRFFALVRSWRVIGSNAARFLKPTYPGASWKTLEFVTELHRNERL